MISSPKNFLFNFSASSIGGGAKRLEEYLKWFDERGGSNFIVNETSYRKYVKKFSNNNFLEVNQSYFDRIFRDQNFLKNLSLDFNNLDFYFSYGIPIYKKVAKKNWFHLSNVAPLKQNTEKTFTDIFRLFILKRRYINNLHVAEYISAESLSSLELLPKKYKEKYVCLLNGSNDEINRSKFSNTYNDYAVAVGTHPYKRIDRVVECYDFLKKKYNLKKLYIFGKKRRIHKKYPKDIEFLGLRPRHEVIGYIENSKFYISCTTTENSFNAASEGIFLSENSLISNIGPHRELLENEHKKEIIVNNKKMFFLNKSELKLKNVMDWNTIIKLMLKHAGIKI